MDQNQRLEYLFQKDLQMSKQIEKTIKDAQPKPKPDMKLKLLKPITINQDLLTGTPEYQAQKQLSDLELDQQISNTIKQAIYAADNKTPEKYTNAVSQEMIDAYRKEVLKPVEVGGRTVTPAAVDVVATITIGRTKYISETSEYASLLNSDPISNSTIEF